jgi:DeoR family transcriptional regulator, suf operon transcriptional repressor
MDRELPESSDRSLLDYLRRGDGASITQLEEYFGVTATAVRQRLTRLMSEGLIQRQIARQGRGRPSHTYRLTDKGRHAAGTNYGDLAKALWQELRAIPDPEIRTGLLSRLAKKLAEQYSHSIVGGDLAERMQSVVRLMGERDVPFAIDRSGSLPVLTVLACPYPTLAEQDRTVCAMEKVFLTELLGQGVRLSECRLDGGSCCSFSPSLGATDLSSFAEPLSQEVAIG